MKRMVPFLFVLGCWSGGESVRVEHRSFYTTKIIYKPVECRLCVKDENPADGCLPPLPVYEWNLSDEQISSRRDDLTSWINYAAHCLGIENTGNVRWLMD
jgi:hypothetical protein